MSSAHSLSPGISFFTRNKRRMHKYGIIIAFFALCLIVALIGEYQVAQGAWSSNYFLSNENTLIVLRQVSINGILAIGMTFVIITAGVDLSVGSVLALSGIVAARFATNNSGLAIGDTATAVMAPLIVALGIGIVCGLVNGTVLARYRLQPFIVTMGMLSAARGLTMLTTNGNPVSQLNSDFRWLGNGYVGGVPVPVIIFIVLFALAWLVLNKTLFGRYIYAVGGNPKSARTSGINVTRIKILVYTLCGALAGIAGLILTARTGSAQTNAGAGYELDAIAAVVIGGTSMAGGVGTLVGTFFGVLIIGVMNNGLDLLGVQSYYQQIIKGALIVLAVLLDPSRKQQRD
ncbi:TPA: ABC transporter permease [Serratia marcescens]|jgi:putative xylitol transport system permease protein|uniref:ABC transporter permease n=4 Tax=Serratia TaxID=613 RepID=A0A0N7JPS8_SERMA|nr:MULTISPECIES: ABC transporter permease [Serratia]MDI6930431.1 ABC transporter permease [Serratia sp. Se-PFBMAAmG]QHI78500.1 ABC transporter permease [Serratia sp. NGAS9]AGE18498.1 sugar ABC transporter permease [Serratia marcescens WW4]AIA48481.1 sugar ABC transporter permease [Serratia sp. FS14]ALL38462.1 sugar ABC transporter permease [Serratia marcescens]